MGFLDRFRKVQPGDSPVTLDYHRMWELSEGARTQIMGMTPAQMWESQPYLRLVVTFLARNIAQLGLHTFQRVSDTDRARLRAGGIADALARPNPTTTAYELVYGLVADLALYDKAYWVIGGAGDNPLNRLPVPWVTPRGGRLGAPEWYEVKQPGDNSGTIRVPADQVLAFHGWNPAALGLGSSPVAALKEILAEQVQAARYRELVWKRGGKVGAVLSRPKDAPAWGDEARKQFKADWDANFTGNGPKVGGTPLLEDGMTLSRVDFSAHEMEFIDGARLALNTVASVYHIPPPMVGLLDNANYSNVREFRKMLYGDTLGPLLAQIEDRINTFLVPVIDGRAGVYVEFNVDEKLQGNFEEQSQALQASVGRPWMTTNEARALRNMPAIDGGDDLVTPLNVLIGGQASAQDSGSQNAEPKGVLRMNSPVPEVHILPSVKSGPTDSQREQVQRVLAAFFKRQGKAVLSKIGAGDGEWWDGDRWDRELSEDLMKVSHTIATILGTAEAKRLGYDDGYDPDRTVEYLTTVAKRWAGNINRTTKTQLDDELGDPDGNPAQVFDVAENSRAAGVAVAVGTFVAGFGTTEAARQLAYDQGVEPTKTWITGPNPRKSHAAMNGQTVPIDEPFSNGCMWPADSPDVDEVAGCNCSVQIDF